MSKFPEITLTAKDAIKRKVELDVAEEQAMQALLAAEYGTPEFDAALETHAEAIWDNFFAPWEVQAPYLAAYMRAKKCEK